MPTVNSKGDPRMIAGVRLREPYGWLGPVLRRAAKAEGRSVSTIARDALVGELERWSGTVHPVWCRRMEPTKDVGRPFRVPPMSLPQDLQRWVPARLEEVTESARDRHIARWSAAVRRIGEFLGSAEAVTAYRVTRGRDLRMLTVIHGADIPADLMDEATGYVTDDLTTADVVRAALAHAFAPSAPDSWTANRWQAVISDHQIRAGGKCAVR